MKNRFKSTLVIAAAALWLPLGAVADTHLTEGEVRKVDLEAGKLTLRHAEIKSLDMPGMTMVFVVKDKALLDKLKAGDKIRFKAINDAGKYTVTEIERAR
jgi:Cu(I)/Ag(I) efflux system periplasmic protein CusF